MSKRVLNNHCRLYTDDLYQFREGKRGITERQKTQLSSGWRYGVKWHQVDLKHISLSYLDSPTAVHVVSGPVVISTYCFGIHEDGTALYRINGYESMLTLRCAGLRATGQVLDVETHPFRALVLTFDETFAEHALTRRFGQVPPLEEWTLKFALQFPSEPIACLRSLVLWMANELDRSDSWLLASPRAATGFERALVELFLDCLRELPAASSRGCDDLATRQVKRVEEWIDANYADAVTISDLAKVAGTSVRSLQAVFRRLRQCTPMEAIARRRLQAARDALRAPEATVTRVATDCGFSHLGRFACKYNQAFGETPLETLEQARRR